MGNLKGPQDNEKFFCLDANFGLVRKASAGSMSLAPHHRSLYFKGQTDCDDFVDTYLEPKLKTVSTLILF